MDLPPMKKISETCWEISETFKSGMRVPVRIYATEKLLKAMDEGVFAQITNVATLPGIVKYAITLPDAHRGYGYPIGGVAAFDPEEGGIISPGGIGFDINCGVRLMRTGLSFADVKPRMEKLLDGLFAKVPAGVGSRGFMRLNREEFKRMVVGGASWAVKKGFGSRADLEKIEDGGAVPGADPEAVSEKALKRGLGQLGTLGSGNHYLEIQRVEKIFDSELARRWGIFEKDQITVMLHCGSRGFGHQIGTDYLRSFGGAMAKYKISVSDRELACAPFKSPEGQAYFGAMVAAANNAFANRQLITHRIREVFEKVFGEGWESLGLNLVYDVAHNIAKVEKFEAKELLVHRKGATRAFEGQPVLIGGSIETNSYLLVGTKKAEGETFASTVHGSGRTMSRSQAKRTVRGEKLKGDLEARGIRIRAVSMPGLAEEAGIAYKDISEVVHAVEHAGLSKPVASFSPIGNIKG